MLRKLGTFVIVFLLALTYTTPAAAVTGGVPDGDGHPYSGLLLVPGYTFCSGTLIDEDLVLTAGHCTSFWSEAGIEEVWVTFDSVASVDPDTWEITGGTWYRAAGWTTHPDYVDADWPFTADYGLVFLDEPVEGITPAALPEPYLLNQIIGSTGQTQQRFYNVGYGQNGVNVGGGPYTRNFDFTRRVATQRFNPSNGAVGTLDDTWLILVNAPSPNHGAGCGGDSGSGVFLDGAYASTAVAVHTGGYRMGYAGRLCGRITSLNHRVDIPLVLDWIAPYLD